MPLHLSVPHINEPMGKWVAHGIVCCSAQILNYRMNENDAKDPKRSDAARRAWKTKKERGIKPFDGHQSAGGKAAASLPPPERCPCCGLEAQVFGSRMAWLAHRSGITQTERIGRAAMARRLQRIAFVKTWRRLSNAYRWLHGLPLISGDDNHPDGIGGK